MTYKMRLMLDVVSDNDSFDSPRALGEMLSSIHSALRQHIGQLPTKIDRPFSEAVHALPPTDSNGNKLPEDEFFCLLLLSTVDRATGESMGGYWKRITDALPQEEENDDDSR